MHVVHGCECVREYAFEPELLFIYPVVETIPEVRPQNARDVQTNETDQGCMLCQNCVGKRALKQHVDTIVVDGDVQASFGETSAGPYDETAVRTKEGGLLDFVSFI